MSEKSEVRCLWAGLFSNLILTRRHPKSSTKLDSSDEKNEETNLVNIRINAAEKSVRNLILDDLHIDKPGPRIEHESDTETVREKIDLSSSRLLKKQDLIRLKNLNAMNRTSIKAPQKNLLSTEQKFGLLSWRRVIHQCSCSPHSNLSSSNERQMICLSPLRTNAEPTELDTEIIFDSRMPSDINRRDTILLHSEDDTTIHFTSDYVSENETITSTVEDVPSTPTSILSFNMSESIKTHHCPVSVLQQFYTEYANNSPNFIMVQSDRKRLQPTCLYFEECSMESSPQDYISKYVSFVLQASSLNWDRLLKIGPQPGKLLRASLFDEVKFSMPCGYCHLDPKLLFDHVNEVLVRIQISRFSFLPRLEKNSIVPLEDLVLDEIKAEEFYLLPSTEERTVDQLVAGSGSWIDVRTEAEYIMIQISERILQESVVDVLLGFRS